MGRRNHASKMLANNTYNSSSGSSMESTNEGKRRRSRRKRDQQTATIAPFATIASRRGSTGTIGVRIWERFSWSKTKRRSSNDRTEDDASPHPQSERNATTNGDNSPTDTTTRRRQSLFDGTSTATSCPFAEFIFDGDDEDRENDEAETRHWAGCQNIN